jgi:hypothetical protein
VTSAAEIVHPLADLSLSMWPTGVASHNFPIVYHLAGIRVANVCKIFAHLGISS